MTKRSDLEKAKADLEAQLAALEEDDDTPEELWLEKDGVKFCIKGEKAKRFLAKHRKLWDDDEEDDNGVEIVSPPKKTAAKKVVKPKEAEEEIDLEDDEEILEDPSPKKQSYWG